MTDRPRLYFHIGAPKTGTTYLQQILYSNSETLQRGGLLYPARGIDQHFLASLDLSGREFEGHRREATRGAWRRLVREVRNWPGTSVIDHEFFGGAKREAVDRALGDLDFAEVHIVMTARDLARQLPAAWQEGLKNRRRWSYAEFLSAVRAGARGGPRGSRFWSGQDVVGILARWSRDLPPERVHVVTVPPPGAPRDLLWDRFAGLIGVDPESVSLGAGDANSSVGPAEAAVLLDFNRAIRDLEIPWPLYAGTIKHGITKPLAARSTDRIGLPQDMYDWAVDWSRSAIASLREAGYDVVGDLDELMPGPRAVGPDPDTVSGDERAAAAVAGMVALMKELASQQQPNRVTRALQYARRRLPPGRADADHLDH